MKDAHHRSELGTFLRKQRERITPQSVGLKTGPRRRTPGLRREEVAALAGVGVTWYTWLEQGRAISVSRSTLQRIGQALQLGSSDAAYLLALGGVTAPAISPTQIEIDDHTRLILHQLRIPALVLSPCLQVLAFNPHANELFHFAADETPFGQNHAWRLFMDPTRRRLYVHWDDVARRTVGLLRLRHGARQGDTSLEALLGALRAASADFLRLWGESRTVPLESTLVSMRHARFGSIKVATVRFLFQADPDYALATLPPADSKTAAAFAGYAGGKYRIA
jgi:transcriptional regulator with XRE-family HTH domain